MSKNVFVLGAGFAKPAGMPEQADIMRDVVMRHSKSFQDDVRNAYTTLFNMVEPEEMRDVPLEDVFTMLDRARRSGETVRGLPHTKIVTSYNALIASITHEFNKKLRNFDKGPYVPYFAELVRERLVDQTADPFSIITLNWDTICDFMIAQQGAGREVVVDYACYDYDLHGKSDHIPSILRRCSGKYNIKLLKLHGSLNWLVCTCCGRIFSRSQDDDCPLVAFRESEKCRFCGDVDLENVVVTPTLLKDLGQTHLKMVWHNALMDLQESERIVFVGYSLPLADFEFRYILLKAITGRSDVRVRVVLYPPDDPPPEPKKKWERDIKEERFNNFFGQRDIEFRYMNAVDFMADPDLIWNW